jgi:hypothetical protein
MRVRADGVLDGPLTADWRSWAVIGGIVLIGLVSLFGMVLAARRRAEERRQLEVPQFSAAEFQRFADHQNWIAQQSVPPPDQPGRPSPPVG